MAPRNLLLEWREKELNTTREEREFYGPIDGVLPQDYPDSYPIIMRSYCITNRDTSVLPIYLNPCNLHIYCKFCFTDDLTNHYVPCDNFHIISYRELTYGHCKDCNELLLTWKPAVNCQYCIEEVLVRSFDLRISNVAVVLKRW
ncbi:hypothetical protein QAD02_013304 [Eretmocerus hayati]|uniref:Uncharacterized protein n=1 Tax=Eretmocerus hayati TaxID=131215 RepID=A0ACC2P500_9HYME|nr:hypothetical protein QAD02_013304 [Eretmocerus hayati]